MSSRRKTKDRKPSKEERFSFKLQKILEKKKRTKKKRKKREDPSPKNKTMFLSDCKDQSENNFERYH